MVWKWKFCTLRNNVAIIDYVSTVRKINVIIYYDQDGADSNLHHRVGIAIAQNTQTAKITQKQPQNYPNF